MSPDVEDSITTNDGVRLRYAVFGREGPAVVMIHGWSGSSKYFALNVPALAKACRVVTLDLRFHGASDKPNWGFHVARLAADLHSLLVGTWLADAKPALLGASLGCAVIWSYVELFGQEAVSKFIFVDQAPSQWLFADWKLGSKGIYDAASLANIQKAVTDLDGFADGNSNCCLSKPPPAEVMAVLKSETLLCNPAHLGALMADHAPKDWRPILPRISVPCLNLYGTDSGCFPPEGCEAVTQLMVFTFLRELPGWGAGLQSTQLHGEAFWKVKGTQDHTDNCKYYCDRRNLSETPYGGGRMGGI